jgi:hypothetical protein
VVSMSRVIARGSLLAVLSAGPRKRVGVGGNGVCDTSWVSELLARARATDSCDQPGADSLVFPASAVMVPGDSATVSVTVQRNGFIGRRLIIPDSYAASVMVNDVRVGGRSIMTSQNPISGETFSTKADVCGFLKFPKSGAGIDYDIDLSHYDDGTILLVAWAINTVYALGARRTNNGNIYQVVVAGTSAGAGGPSGMGDAIVDNTVTWRYVGPVTVTARGIYIEGASW